MTIDQLLEAPIEVLEEMSDSELRNFFEPYLNATRPERVAAQPKDGKTRSAEGVNRSGGYKKAKAQNLNAMLNLFEQKMENLERKLNK